MVAITPSIVTRSVMFVQQRDLINRGIQDVLGLAVPMIALARTPEEKREKLLDRAIVIGTAFFMAPLHALFFRHEMTRWFKLPHKALMQISYRDLLTPQQTQKAVQGLKTLPGQSALQALPAQLLKQFGSWERVRTQLIKAKTWMWIPDMAVECLIFGCVGWVTNFFSQKMTGKKQFTGELQDTSAENLKALQSAEKDYQKSEFWRQAASVILSVGIPILTGLLVKRAVTRSGQSKGLNGLFQRLSHKFDYKDGYWMSLWSLAMVSGVQLVGSLLSARNPRELREKIIKEGAINLVFFGAQEFILSGLARLFYKPFGIPVVENDVAKVIAGTPNALKKRAGALASALYISMILMNSAILALIICSNNIMTRFKVRADVQKLQQKPLHAAPSALWQRPVQSVPVSQPRWLAEPYWAQRSSASSISNQDWAAVAQGAYWRR